METTETGSLEIIAESVTSSQQQESIDQSMAGTAKEESPKEENVSTDSVKSETCTTCSGKGRVSDTESCETCEGTGIKK